MQVMVLSSGKRVVTVAKDAKAPVPVQPAGDVPAMWHYLDPNSNEQGPFTAARILKWEARGHFDGSLKVRHSGASAWETLDHARPAMIRASEIQAASAAVAGGEHAPQPQTGMGLHGGQPQQPQPHSQPHQQPQPQPQPQPIQEQEQPTQQRQAPQQAPPQPSDWQQQYPKQQQQQRRQQQQAPPRPGEVYTEAPYNGGGLGGGRGGYERNGSYDRCRKPQTPSSAVPYQPGPFTVRAATLSSTTPSVDIIFMSKHQSWAWLVDPTASKP